MKRNLLMLLVTLLVTVLVAGCAGDTIVVQMPEATAPVADDTTAATEQADETTGATEQVEGGEQTEAPAADGAVKTGLAISTSLADSTSAAADAEGNIKYDLTIAAVVLDGNGVIQSCRVDSVPATVAVDATGAVTSDLTAAIRTKNEQGADYGMVAWGGAIAEWDAQVAALCDYAVGKTVEELKNGAIDASGKAPEGSDLASSATIYLGGYVSMIEAAANNAQALGANADDELVLVTESSLSSTTAATADAAGNAQLDVNVAALTRKDGVITSCILDAVQAKVAFDAAGQITSDLTAPVKTKNELGADYGMVAWGGAIAEWNEQAASFAAYVTGKTADEVAGIAINEATKPADGSDLASSVTISVGGFQSLIAKAFN